MLKRIIKIENVGRIRKLAWKAIGDLPKVSLFYGENGSGKTTISSALAAASGGDVSAMKARRRLSGGTPIVEILTSDAGKIDFDGTRWNKPYQRLSVFNRDFVHKNVFVGNEIGPDQRQNLYELAIGEQAIASKQRVESIKTRIKELKKARDECERSITALISVHQFSLEELSAAQPVHSPPVDHEENKLRAVKRKTGPSLSAFPSFRQPTPLPPFDIHRLNALLNTSVEGLSDQASIAVQQHIALNLGTGGEAWLATGASFSQNKQSCPYCGQDLTHSNLAALYSTYFNHKYEQLKLSIAKGIERLDSLSEWAHHFVSTERHNHNAALQWQSILPVPQSPDAASLGDIFQEFTKSTRVLLEAKSSRPLETPPKNLVDALVSLRATLERIFQDYAAWTKEVAAFTSARVALEDAETRELHDKVRQIELGMLRANPNVGRLIDMLGIAGSELATAEQDLESAKKDLDSLSTATTLEFASNVNSILKEFGASFQVVELTKKESTTRITADFALQLDGKSIFVSSKSDDKPGFNTILSEADRNTLGLAVFIAHVQSRSDISKRVLVFDDPFTSLDRNRRTKTCAYIKTLTNMAAQSLVFSHDEFFLRDVRDQFPEHCEQRSLDSSSDCCELREWDAHEACRNRYFATIDRLRHFIAVGCAQAGTTREQVWAELRPLLEEYLRFRFPRFWTTDGAGKKLWLADFVRLARNGPRPHELPNIFSQKYIAKLEEWKGFGNPPHHGESIQPISLPTEGELRTYAQEILEFVES